MSNLADFIGGGGIPENEDVFTSSGTWTCPSNVKSIIIDATAGGGANSGGGGGSSRFTGQIVKVTPNLDYTVIVGAAGGNTSLSETASGNVVFLSIAGGNGASTTKTDNSNSRGAVGGVGGRAGTGGINGLNAGSVSADSSNYLLLPKNGNSATGSIYNGVEYGGAGLAGIMIIRY